MLDTPILNLGFIALTVLELLYFYWACGKQRIILSVSIAWLALQASIAYSGFYLETDAVPPRFILVLLPTLIIAIIYGWSKYGNNFRSKINFEKLHYVHIVRIFVEVFFLYGMFKAGYVAEEVTFEGNNFDIIPGLTAPIIAYLYYQKKKISKGFLLWWNILSACVLLFTISQALLSAPFPFQVLSLEQPTVAFLYFPMVWLPAFVAPLVIFSHVMTIRVLTEKGSV